MIGAGGGYFTMESSPSGEEGMVLEPKVVLMGGVTGTPGLMELAPVISNAVLALNLHARPVISPLATNWYFPVS